MENMTEEKATALFNEWVKRLHLEEWHIIFRWKVRNKDISVPDSMGVTSSNYVAAEAMIEMLDPVDDNVLDFEYDYEKTLVHELLHLKFSALYNTGDDLRDKLTHRMIEDMAKAMVSAKRGE